MRATVRWNSVPLLADARELVSAGYVTGGSARNWQGCAGLVDLTSHGAVEQALLTDPQTSGGLLVACAPEAVDDVLDCFHADGFHRAAVIGDIESGSAWRVGGVASRGHRGAHGRIRAESDTCLVVVTVFKIVAPALCAGGWVRFPPSPPTFADHSLRSRLRLASRVRFAHSAKVGHGWRAVALAKAGPPSPPTQRVESKRVSRSNNPTVPDPAV